MKRVIITIFVFSLFCFSQALATEIGFKWDHNDPLPDGYRLFQKCGNDPFDYTAPIWDGKENFCGPFDVADGVKCYYVVRAYVDTMESEDSVQVRFYKPTSPQGIVWLLWQKLKELLGIP